MVLWPSINRRNENGTVSYDIPSALLDERIVLLEGEIDSQMAMSIVSQLLYLESVDKESPITIYIDSPGGSVTAGFSIYDIMNKISCPINTVCLGMAASMGAFLLCSGSHGRRYCMPNSQVMIHQPLTGTGGIVQAQEIKILSDSILNTRERLYNIMALNCQKTFEEIEKACDRDNYLSADQALDFGLIDKIVEYYPKAVCAEKDEKGE